MRELLTLSGIGLPFPATMSIGHALARNASGAASALLGGFQFLFGEGSTLPMALIMLTAVAVAAAALVALGRPWQGDGEPAAAMAS